MGRIVMAQIEDTEKRAFPQLTGVSTQGSVATRGVIAEDDRDLLLWMHELAPGAVVAWSTPPVDHLTYIWAGDVEIDGQPLAADGVVVVEHKGSAVLRAGSKGATLAHFHSREGGKVTPSRAGGHKHVVPPEGLFEGGGATVLADSACPTCTVWMHRSRQTKPRPQDNKHRHTEDEIVVVKDGGMKLGKRIMPPGTVLAIDVDTIYSFGVPDEGLDSLTFRATDPHIVRLDAKNQPLNEPYPMRDQMKVRVEKAPA